MSCKDHLHGNLDDRRQITATFVVNLSGEFLPIQLIYTGTTGLGHPKVNFPTGFDVNHWANEEKVISLLNKIVFPFVQKKRESLNMANDSKALLRGQTTAEVNILLEKNNCLGQHVPNNHTNLFQPLDISVNKSAKYFMSNKYQDWYVSKVASQLERGVEPHDVKVGVKPLHAGWIIDYHKHMQSSRSVITSGFRKALITEAAMEAEALYKLMREPVPGN